MKPLRRKRKLLWLLALAVLGLLLAPFVAVQVQERIFRHRAERLLADMRGLMVHKANLAEIQAVFKRWNPNGDPCSGKWCSFQTDLQYRNFPDSDGMEAWDWRELWPHLFRMFGGRLAFVRAQAAVQDGVVLDISFQIDMETFSTRDVNEYARIGHPGNILSGQAATVRRFSIRNDWRGLSLHSNYVINEGYPQSWHPRTPDVYVEFGPHADPADTERLGSFDLSCLTRLVACRKPGDIMPEAAAQFTREAPQLAQARKEQVCSPDVVALMAREAGRAGVVEMTGSHTGHLGYWGAGPILTVRLIQDFEPASDWKTGESHELLILDANTDRPVTNLPPEVYPGNQFILLAESGFHYRWVETYRCGILPLYPANLELVQQATAGNLPAPQP
jgi:hypothetical protein